MVEHGGRTRVLIMGAAGRDFHNFNIVYRDDPAREVVAFTAAQIPHIAGRLYPPQLAGALYPDGVPILEEMNLRSLCRDRAIDQVVFAYSDVSHARVMEAGSQALAAGADFLLLGPARTMIQSSRPVIAVSAVRTGCGKSQTARWISRRLRARGISVCVIRHPMPYGDLAAQAVQRLATRADLDAARCTVEEREEYEPHLAAGNVVYSGVDYEAIVARAEREAELLLWDGGNNDFPFLRPDLHLVLVDALRPEHVQGYHPGEAVLRMADVVVIAKASSAAAASVAHTAERIRRLVPGAHVVRMASEVRLADPRAVAGRRVLVIEDGPTLTHGGMAYGAGYVAARQAHAGAIVDPRGAPIGELASVFEDHPHIGPVLPALGYGAEQLSDLAGTIRRVDADVVVSATPCDLQALIDVDKPVVRAFYDLAEIDDPGLSARIDAFLDARRLGSGC